MKDDFNNKELKNTYKKNGYTVKIYTSVMSDKERKARDAQVKYDILNLIKNNEVKNQII